MLNSGQLKKITRAILATQAHEIGCDTCFQELDRFVDRILAGKDVAQAMPLVQAHLDRCQDCWEEFNALLQALKSSA